MGYCTFIYCTGDRCGLLHIYLLHRRSVWVLAYLFIAQEIGVGYSVAKSNDARGRFFMQPCRHAACRIQYSEQDYEHCYIVICKGG